MPTKIRTGAKRITCILFLLFLSASLCAASGCGGKKDDAGTVEDSIGEEVTGAEGGEVAVNPEAAGEGESEDASQGGDAGTMTVGEGEVSYHIYQEAPSEEELGAPLYPGASYLPSSGGSVSGTAPEGDFTTTGGEFHTDDGFQQVLAWYRDRLGEPLFLEPSQSTATWSRREGNRMVVVGLRGETSGTTIAIYNLQGSEELLP